MKTIYYYISGGVIIVLVAFAAIWFAFLRPTASLQSTSQNSGFAVAPDNTTSVSTTNSDNSNGANGSQQIAANGQVATTKIFEITAGPVVGATLIQTLNPTTTLARYIDQSDGHVYDLPLDVPGSLPRVVSNTTIPGGERALWTAGGNAILQYLEGSTVKTLYMSFAASGQATTTQTLTHLQFFPDGIEDIAVSPDGKSAVYLLPSAGGVEGFISQSSGLNGKEVFSLPLSQVLVSWPSQGTIMVQTKSAAGVPGIVFSINAPTGAVTPLIYADGITAIADPSFTHVIYQSVAQGATTRFTYVHTVKTGTDAPLSFSPLPEKCIWSPTNTLLMYCATPLQYVDPNYLDLWHTGEASAADGLFSFNVSTGQSALITSPGASDGGTATDILEMALSPDEHYLDFVSKGDRSLWGVRLTQ